MLLMAKKPGRPSRGNTVRILISMTKEELAEIDAGIPAGLERSSFIRSAILRYLRRKARYEEGEK